MSLLAQPQRLDRRPQPGRADPGDRIEPFRRRAQRGERWCWAATVSSAIESRGVRRRQWRIVSEYKVCGTTGCERASPSECCDQPVDRTELEAIWRGERFFSARFLRNRRLSFEQIKEAIAARTPLLLEQDNRHVILVFGWFVDELGVEKVRIVDTHSSGRAIEQWNYKDLDIYNEKKWGPWTGTCVNLVYTPETV